MFEAGAEIPILGDALATNPPSRRPFLGSRATHSGLPNDLDWGTAYVRPVERLTPARKAETSKGCQLE